MLHWHSQREFFERIFVTWSIRDHQRNQLRCKTLSSLKFFKFSKIFKQFHLSCIFSFTKKKTQPNVIISLESLKNVHFIKNDYLDFSDCALSRVRRWSFLLADHFCEHLGVELTPGVHLPINAALSDSSLSLGSAFASDSESEVRFYFRKRHRQSFKSITFLYIQFTRTEECRWFEKTTTSS